MTTLICQTIKFLKGLIGLYSIHPELFQPINSKTLVEIGDVHPEELFIRVERQTIRRLKSLDQFLYCRFMSIQ